MSRKLRIEYPGAMFHVMSREDQCACARGAAAVSIVRTLARHRWRTGWVLLTVVWNGWRRCCAMRNELQQRTPGSAVPGPAAGEGNGRGFYFKRKLAGLKIGFPISRHICIVVDSVESH